jgi:general secretion pathway protein A
MYLQSFGLREKPFALSPDPRYLFLSESHREALAHLLYGVDQGEGFIAVVGEVGTGKTTLCRTLLQRLGSETEVAFLFNPDLSPHELLEAVCREFELGAPPGASRRDLLDRIDEFLVTNRGAGRRVLLIIDEAQNLPAETLEQVRLLSNLETETSKLIQIVLLGQPELEAKLASKELRQLGQRVSVWWKLSPMKRAEAFEYVRHRLRVAGNAGRSPFSEGALREVHRRAMGVPRVMNILCDRSLLTAYAANAREVRAVHVRRAAAELGPSRSHGVAKRARHVLLHPGWFAAAGAVAIAFGLWQALGGAAWLPGAAAPGGAPASLPAVAAPPPSAPAAETPADEAAEPAATDPRGLDVRPESSDPRGLDALLERSDARAADAAAAHAMLASWSLEPDAPIASRAELFAALEAGGLLVRRVDGDLDALRALNLPALVRLSGPDGEPRSAVLRHLDDGAASLLGLGGATLVRVPEAELAAHLDGEAFVAWRDFVSLPPVLRGGHAGTSVYWLQTTLAELGFYGARPSGRYDDPTRSAVRAFQTSRGLEPDGEVGPATKISLYDALGDYRFPRLRAARG